MSDEEIVKYVNEELKDKDFLNTEDVMNKLNVTKQDIFRALYSKGGYTISGALVDYGIIGKLTK